MNLTIMIKYRKHEKDMKVIIYQMEFMKAEKNMTVQDLIDELMLVKDKSKEIRVVVNTNDYITSYPASLFDMSIKEGEDIAKDHFDNIIAIELYR